MIIGRFAPSPSGYLHPGNLLCALLAWLSARCQGGHFLLRIEDLDEGRCPASLGRQAIEDLNWLGLTWDGPILWQSQRREIYARYLNELQQNGLLYPCYCTRRELHAAPNRGDFIPVYSGHCRSLTPEDVSRYAATGKTPSLRIRVPDETICFTDKLCGPVRQWLPGECGDFIVRRADGIHAYHLAVVIDDALSGVTEVLRGCDLLTSTPCQIFLQRTLGFPQPTYLHIPLLEDEGHRRLAKRDRDVSLQELARTATRDEILGALAYSAGLIPERAPVTLKALLKGFHPEQIPSVFLPFSLT